MALERIIRGQYDGGAPPDKPCKRVKTPLERAEQAPLGFSGNLMNVRTIQVVNTWRCDLTLRRLVLSPTLGAFIGSVTGWPSVRVAQDQVWLKPPSAPGLGFHRDRGYFMFKRMPQLATAVTSASDRFEREGGYLNGVRVVTLWIALDDMHEELGPLQLAVGSHKWRQPAAEDGGTNNQFFSGNHGEGIFHMCFVAARKHGLDPKHIRFQSLAGTPAGAGSLHDGDTWHGSPPNTSTTRPRRGVGIHYVRGDVLWDKPAASRSQLWRPYVSALGAHDESVTEKHFPIVWREGGKSRETTLPMQTLAVAADPKTPPLPPTSSPSPSSSASSPSPQSPPRAVTPAPAPFAFQATRVRPWLFLGDVTDSANGPGLTQAGITHVLNVTNNLPNCFEQSPPAPGYPSIKYYRICIRDLESVDISVFFDPAIAFLDSVHAKRETVTQSRVLVHCAAGRSRSASIVLAFLVARERLSLQKAFEELKRLRPIVRPNIGFYDYLRQHELRCLGSMSAVVDSVYERALHRRRSNRGDVQTKSATDVAKTYWAALASQLDDTSLSGVLSQWPTQANGGYKQVTDCILVSLERSEADRAALVPMLAALCQQIGAIAPADIAQALEHIITSVDLADLRTDVPLATPWLIAIVDALYRCTVIGPAIDEDLHCRFKVAASAFFARWDGSTFLCRRVRARVRGGVSSPPKAVAQVLGMTVATGDLNLEVGEVYRCLPNGTWSQFRVQAQAEPFTLPASEREFGGLAVHFERLRSRMMSSAV